MTTAGLAALQKRLSHTFADPALLERAVTHRSHSADHNERLEFLGDAVLDLAVGHRLMVRFPQLREGELSVTRAQVVSEAGLAEVALGLSLGDWLCLGKGEDRSGGRQKPSILADAFEALVAAVYLDGGFPAAWDLVGRLLRCALCRCKVSGVFAVMGAGPRRVGECLGVVFPPRAPLLGSACSGEHVAGRRA